MSLVNNRQRLRVYLAGPEVFFEDAKELAREKKRLCARHGFLGVFPLDQEIDTSTIRGAMATARAISRGNERLIRDCDLLIANCTPFRGVSMDAGTAYEMGFARALGRPVFGYTNVTSDYRARTLRFRSTCPGYLADRKNSQIEDFGLAENLMLATISGGDGADLIRTRVARSNVFKDLTGFARCLLLAKEMFGPRSRRTQGTYAAARPRRKRT